jgi:hypothetical protein
MGFFAFGAITLAFVLLVVARGYGHADPILRRRVRWVVYGIYCAAIPMIAIAGGLDFRREGASLGFPTPGWGPSRGPGVHPHRDRPLRPSSTSTD